MDILLSSLVGGIIGLVLGVIFEEPLTAAKKRVIRRVRAILSWNRKPDNKPATFTLGSFDTSWLVIDGNGELAYSPETIICCVEPGPAHLPPEIESRRAVIEERERARKAQGLAFQWNGPLYALERYAIGRNIPDEDLEVVLTLRPTDYFTFQATVANLDDILPESAHLTLRQKYLDNHDLSQPIGFLANGFGVAMVIFTSDQKLLLYRRHETTGVRSGQIDASVVEGVHPTLDRSITHRGPDLYHTAIRGAEEELGIELVQDQITFLGFGVDLEYYQWNMLGVARASETSARILERYRRGTSGRWESRKVEIIDSNPRVVFSYLKQEKLWSTGIAAIYWALVHEYGRKKVEQAAKVVFG